MSLGTPDGQLIIENATVITNNINVQDRVGVATDYPQYNLDVHGTANVGVLFVTSIAGDGGLLSNLASNLEEITVNGNVTTKTIEFTNSDTSIVASGNIHASHFIGDGSFLSNVINDTELESNVSILRTEMESNTLALRTDLQSNVSTLRGEMTSNTLALRTDLQSNVSTLRTEMTSNTLALRTDLQSNVSTLRGEMTSNTLALRTDLQSNVSTLRGEMTSNTLALRTDLQSNVSILRTEMESNTLALRTDLQSNVSTLRGEMASNTLALRTDLQSNVSILRTEMESNTLALRTDLQSNVSTLRGEMASNTLALRTDLQSNVGILRGEISRANTITFSNVTTGLIVDANVVVGGNVTANVFLGDGGLLSNIAATLQEVSDNGNTTSNTLQFLNAHTAFTTDLTSNVGVNLGQLSDVVITTPLEDQIVKYDGSNWINGNPNKTIINVKNTNGVSLPKGTVVCAVNTTGNNTFNVHRANASNVAAMPAIGVLNQTLEINGQGTATTFGRTNGLSGVGSFLEGETLYVSNVAGLLSNVKPYSLTDQIQNVGILVNPNAGVVFVTGVGRSNDIPNAPISSSPNYVYVNETNNDMKKIAPENLLTKLQTLEQVVNTGNTVSNSIEITGNLTVSQNVSIGGIATSHFPVIGSDGYLRASTISTDNGTTVIASNLEITGDIIVSGNSYIIESNSVVIEDRVFGIANNNTSHTLDVGIIMQHPGKNIALIHHGEDGDPHEHEFTIGYTQNTVTDNSIVDDTSNAITVRVLGNLITQNNITVDSGGSYFGDGTTLTGVALETDLSDNVLRISTLETDLDDNSSRIGVISTDLSDNALRISTLETDLDDNSSRIGVISTDLSDNALRISTLETDLSDNVLRISTLETDLDDNSSRIGVISADLSDNSSRIGLVSTDLSDNALRISTLETDLGDVSTDLSDNVLRISTLETNLDDNSSRIGVISTDLSDNTLRISTLETDLGDVSTDLSDNTLRISTLETDLDDNSSRIGVVSTDLSDNALRISTLETGDITISGLKTFSEEVTFESNINVKGEVFVANTVNMIVSDPIIELGANNLNTGDLGIVMTRHGANSNVAVFYDESSDILKLGYTLNGANDSTIELDSNHMPVSIQGNVGIRTSSPAYALDVHGNANVNVINVNTIQGLQTMSFSSDSTTVPPLQLTASSLNDGVGALRIDSIEPDIFLNDTDGGFSTVTFANNGQSRAAFGRNNADDFYITVRDPSTNGGNWRNTALVVDSSSGNVSIGYGLSVGSNDLFVDATSSNVGIGTNQPGYELDVSGNIHLTGGLYQDGAPFVSSLWNSSGSDLYYTAGNVGISNSAPGHDLSVGSNLYVEDIGSNVLTVEGNVSANYFIGDGSKLSNVVSTLEEVLVNGNETGANVIKFQNTTSIVTTGNVGIANSNPTCHLSVGSNLCVNDTGSNVLTVEGNVSAHVMTLDSIQVVSGYTLEYITRYGNTTSNTVEFTNATTGLVTTANVGIANSNPTHTLDVGSNLWVEDTGSNVLYVNGNTWTSKLSVGSNLYSSDTDSNVLTVEGNVSAHSIWLGSVEITPSYTLEEVTSQGNVTSNVIQFTNSNVGIVSSGGIVVNKDAFACKHYAYSNVSVPTDFANVAMTFASNVFHAKITAQLTHGNEEVSTMTLDVQGGTRDGTTSSLNIATGPGSVFGNTNTKPWNGTVTTTPTQVILEPSATGTTAYGVDLYVEYKSSAPDGKLESISIGNDSVKSFVY